MRKKRRKKHAITVTTCSFISPMEVEAAGDVHTFGMEASGGSGSGSAGGSGGASYGSTDVCKLLMSEEDPATLSWVAEFPNTHHLRSAMTLLRPVIDTDFPFVIQHRGGTADMIVSVMKKDYSLYASARVACNATFFDDRGKPMKVGEQRLTVNFKTMKRALQLMGANSTVIMFQKKDTISVNLFIRVLRGSKCTNSKLPTSMDSSLDPLPNFKFQHSLYLPVQQFREDLQAAHDMANEIGGPVTFALYAIPGAPPSHMMFVLRASGIGDSVSEWQTYVGPAPDLHMDTVDTLHSIVRSAPPDMALSATSISVFGTDSKKMRLLYEGKFKATEPLNVLKEMRNETYIDLFVGRAAEDITSGSMPLLLRMSGGPDLVMHFVAPSTAPVDDLS